MENESLSLTESEAAFFQSGGETPVVETVDTPVVVPAPEAKPAPEPENRDEKGRFVPHQALHAEREEHKKTRAELNEIRERQARLDERWNMMLAVQEKPVEAAPPSPEQDIFGYSKWQQDQILALNAKIEGREKQEAEARQEQEQETSIWNEWHDSVRTFATEQADFQDAAKFLADARDKQLSAYGVVDARFKEKVARDQQVNAELKQIIAAAKAQGISPASAVYQISQQYGYAAKAEEQQIDPGKMELSDKLSQVAAAIDASKTLGQAAGRAGADALSAQAIADMPAHEFEAWMKVPENSRRFRSLMGG